MQCLNSYINAGKLYMTGFLANGSSPLRLNLSQHWRILKINFIHMQCDINLVFFFNLYH